MTWIKYQWRLDHPDIHLFQVTADQICMKSEQHWPGSLSDIQQHRRILVGSTRPECSWDLYWKAHSVSSAQHLTDALQSGAVLNVNPTPSMKCRSNEHAARRENRQGICAAERPHAPGERILGRVLTSRQRGAKKFMRWPTNYTGEAKIR